MVIAEQFSVTRTMLCVIGNILPASQIMANLQYILDDKSERPSHSIGYLPTQNRDIWAQAREHLLASGKYTVLLLSLLAIVTSARVSVID